MHGASLQYHQCYLFLSIVKIELRRELHFHSNVKATSGEFDNRENVKKQVKLRHRLIF